MLIFKKNSDLKIYLNQCAKKTIGFTPTMGALHIGHISLIEISKKYSDLTICSIFVNPTQFNEQTDLENYPTTIGKDIYMLEAAGCDILYLPDILQIYPPNFDLDYTIDFKGIDSVMEGFYRPGHFEGVVQVVKRLLDIVQPQHLYMGQKDFQQFSIINELIKQKNIPVQIRICPISRTPSGLARSSRNINLTEKTKLESAILYQTLLDSKQLLNNIPVCKIEELAIHRFSSLGFQAEYFSIFDGYSFQYIKNPSNHNYIVCCTAVWVGDVRLIDNMIYKYPNKKPVDYFLVKNYS